MMKLYSILDNYTKWHYVRVTGPPGNDFFISPVVAVGPTISSLPQN